MTAPVIPACFSAVSATMSQIRHSAQTLPVVRSQYRIEDLRSPQHSQGEFMTPPPLSRL